MAVGGRDHCGGHGLGPPPDAGKALPAA